MLTFLTRNDPPPSSPSSGPLLALVLVLLLVLPLLFQDRIAERAKLEASMPW